MSETTTSAEGAPSAESDLGRTAPAGETAAAAPAAEEATTEQLLTGALVRLRELRDDDVPQLVEWWNDLDLAPLQTNGPAHPRPADGIEAQFRQWSRNDGTDLGLSVVTRAGGRLAGHATLYGADVKDRCATFAIVIGPPFQGRGIGGDVLRVMLRHGFTELGLHRIELTVNGYNDRALAVYARAGFREEGRRRESVFRHGRWHDLVLMGILDREWHEREAAAG